MKKMISRILFLSLILNMSILAGYGTEKDAAWEKEKKEAVEKYLAQAPNLKHGEVSVGAKDESITINNLTNFIVFANEGRAIFVANFAIDKIHAQGVNFSDTKGVINLVDKVTVSNMTCTITFDKEYWEKETKSEQPSPELAVTVIEEIVLEKVRDDIDVALRAMILEKISLKDLKEMSTYKNAHIGKLIMKNMTFASAIVPHMQMKQQIDEFFVNDLSLKHCGEGNGKNYLVEINDEKVFFAEELGHKEMNLVGILPVLNLVDDPVNVLKHVYSPFIIFNHMGDPVKILKQEIMFDNFYAKKVEIGLPTRMISIKEISGTLIKKVDDAFSMKFGVKEASIPSNMLDGFIGGIKKLSDFYDKPFLLTGEFDVLAAVKDDKVVIDVAAVNLSDSNLGGIKSSLQIEGKGGTFNEGIPQNVEDFYLNQLSTTMTDTGFLDLGFTLFSASISDNFSEAKEAGKLMRAQRALVVSGMCLNRIGPNFQDYCNAISGFIAAPGILDVSLNPTEPILIDYYNIKNIDDPTKLGLKVKFTSGK